MKQGTLLEQLVAAIQDHLKGHADVTIELNKKLPDRDGHKREIDVYVTRKCQGLPIAFAFECKDYNKPVDVKVVDAFVGKCQELPEITNRVIVSSSGFTKLAIESASKRGVQLCSIEDVKANNFYIPFIAQSAHADVVVANMNWRFNFKGLVKDESIDRSKLVRYVDDNSNVELIPYFNNQFLSVPLQAQFVERYMKHGKVPYNTIVHHIPMREIYVEEYNGTKHIIESIDVPVHVYVTCTPMSLSVQKNYSPILEGNSVTISEFGVNTHDVHLVSLDSAEGHTILLRDESGRLIKPNIDIRGNFLEK